MRAGQEPLHPSLARQDGRLLRRSVGLVGPCRGESAARSASSRSRTESAPPARKVSWARASWAASCKSASLSSGSSSGSGGAGALRLEGRGGGVEAFDGAFSARRSRLRRSLRRPAEGLERVIGICRRRHKGSSMHRSPRSVGSLEEDRSSSTAHPQFPEQFPEPGLPVVLSSVGVDPLALARSPSWSLVHLTSVVGMTHAAWPNIPVLTYY